MSVPGARAPAKAACERCLRRSWLLAELSARLEFCALERGRLVEVLALDDQALIAAIGGRRRDALSERYAAFEPESLECRTGHESVCRHDRAYPRLLEQPVAPAMLHVAGGVARLRELTGGPAVAIVGAERASDYGLEIARSIARGLSASGVTVVSRLADGIATAAQVGALESRQGSIAVLGGGLKAGCPARGRSLYGRVVQGGCAVAELPCLAGGRRWCKVASERIVAGLAGLTLVVEAAGDPGTMTDVMSARVLGRPVAAVPGRVTSRLSAGTHALLRCGAPLVCSAEDVLDLLGLPPAPATTADRLELPRRLRSVLDAVGEGSDTPDKLGSGRADPGGLLLALTELELMGLLVRGDGGRYLPCGGLAG
jgi:DNA processing protein